MAGVVVRPIEILVPVDVFIDQDHWEPIVR